MESLPSGFELPMKSNHPGRQDDENTGASPEKIDGTKEPRLRWHFHPIANARAHEDVVEQIIFSILSGVYSADDRLPSVEQLAQAMNVSKPVIGEALKVLIKAKIVRVQRGRSGGLFVLTNNHRRPPPGRTAPGVLARRGGAASRFCRPALMHRPTARASP